MADKKTALVWEAQLPGSLQHALGWVAKMLCNINVLSSTLRPGALSKRGRETLLVVWRLCQGLSQGIVAKDMVTLHRGGPK